MGDEYIDVLLLQERCRKDPESYREEFVTQQRHFEALLASARLQPSAPSPRLAEVSSFMAAVAHCYADNRTVTVVPAIAAFLTDSGPVMDPELRRALVRLLALLRARNSADPTIVIPLFFRLLECNDKVLRRMLHGHIVSDIKKMNMSGHVSRGKLQSFLFGMVADPNEVLVKRSLHVLVDLFRKHIWNDAKCANMIANAAFHSATSVASISAKFLLDSESKTGEVDDDDGNDDDDAGGADGAQGGPMRDSRKAADMWKAFNMTSKKTSKKRKRIERVINRLTKMKSSSAKSAVTEQAASQPAFEAMLLLNDPQEFAERLFSDLQSRRKKESFETRLVFINLISRLVGTHQVILFNFYPFLQRYLQPSQPEVTRVLAYLTQACHDHVPSDVLHPILRGLADTFVSERSSPPAMAAGLNAIRAICSRVPLAILDETNELLPREEQESPLLLDLVQYKTDKDRGVMMAGRSLIALYREVQPTLLHKRDRGKAASEAVQKGEGAHARAYGEHVAATGVEGVELLAAKSDDEDDVDGSDDDGSHAIKRSDDDVGSEVANEDDTTECMEAGDNGDIATGEKGAEVDPVPACDIASDAGSDVEKMGKNVRGDDEDVGEDDIIAGGDDSEVGEADDSGEMDEKDNDGEQGDVTNEPIDTMQFLSNEDYAKIRARRAVTAVGGSALTKNTGKEVDPDDIQGPLKRARQTLAERLESVLEGRDGREFGSRKGQNKGGGSTNKKKLKSKANSMVIHKRRQRSQLSRRDKQVAKRPKRDYR